MNMEEFEIFNKYSEIYVDKAVRKKVLAELKDLLERIVKAAGGQRAIRDAAGVMLKAERALVDAESAGRTVLEAEAAMVADFEAREGNLQNLKTSLDARQRALNKLTAAADKEVKKARREISAHAKLSKELKVVKEQLEAKLANIAAAAA